MNVALIDPFELHNELPEVVEKRIEPPSSSVTCCTFNRRGNLLAGALCTFHFAFIPSLYTPVKSETSLSLSHTHTHRLTPDDVSEDTRGKIERVLQRTCSVAGGPFARARARGGCS